MTSSVGLARSKSSGAPPTMIVSVPSAARGAEPVTGASRNRTPCSSSAAPIRRASAGPHRGLSPPQTPPGGPRTAAGRGPLTPSPTRPTRSRSAMPASPRRLQPEPLTFVQRPHRLRFYRLALDHVPAALAVPAAGRASRRMAAALGEQRVGQPAVQRLHLAHHAIAAAVLARAARAAPDRVLGDA